MAPQVMRGCHGRRNNQTCHARFRNRLHGAEQQRDINLQTAAEQVVHRLRRVRVGNVDQCDAGANLVQFDGKVRHPAAAPGHAFAVIREFGTLFEVWWCRRTEP